MTTASSYQSSRTKLPGDKFASAWYTNAKGYKWAKYEDITDPDLTIALVPGKHIRYPTKDDDDFCLVSSEKYGMNVYRNTPEQVKAFFSSREAGSDDKTAGEQAVAARPQQYQQQQQKTIDSLEPVAAPQEQRPASLFPQKTAEIPMPVQTQTIQTQTHTIQTPPPSNDITPSNRVAVMLKWKFWEDKAGLDMLARNYEAGWIVEKVDTRDDGHLCLMRRKN